MIITMLGPPGSGKGTQSKLVSKKYALPHISTGDILREAIAENTELGKKANAFVKKGELVPDNIITSIIEQRTREKDCRKGFILDGFPRTIAQAEALEKLIKKGNLRLEYVFYVKCPDDVLIKRISGRRTCQKCGAVFHVFYNPPKIGNICDKCNTALIQRDDEREDVVRNRLKVYRKQTKPLIDFYEARGVLREIDGENTIEEIFRQIVSFLG